MHQDPIPSVHHLPCHLGIAGFIWVPEVPPVQIDEVEDNAESEEEKDLDPFLRIDLRRNS
jgi:hypothetical protein